MLRMELGRGAWTADIWTLGCCHFRVDIEEVASETGRFTLPFPDSPEGEMRKNLAWLAGDSLGDMTGEGPGPRWVRTQAPVDVGVAGAFRIVVDANYRVRWSVEMIPF